jgi:hypothetical protein
MRGRSLLFYRLRKYLAHSRFDRQTRRILDTPPIAYKEAPLSIVSMVQESDVQMYIIAVKSLYRRLGRGRIVTIVLRDFPQRDRDLIRRHLGPVEFHALEDLPTGRCQRGGTWERLVFCANRSASEYVIQIDSDVLCIGPIEDVLSRIDENRAFVLAEGIPIQPLPAWVEKGIARKSDNIVTAFEIRGAEFPDADKWLYVRGSSGFAGFAKGGITLDFLEKFHAGGQQVHGARWTEWGTEQIASNAAIANTPNSAPLPYPKYATFEPEYATFQKKGITEDMSLLHFIGAFRFDMGVFPRLANREIDRMLKAAKS